MSNKHEHEAYVENGIGYLPLLDRHCALVGWGRVDECDFGRLSKLTWRLHSSGTAVHCSGSRQDFTTLSLGRAVLKLPPVGNPRVGHANGDALDCTRANLRLPRRFLAERIDCDADFAVSVARSSLQLTAGLLDRHRQASHA
jgi:hypothetical protein